ncbi:MAG: membrane protein insertion efficiency factor YidD [Labilithrix sp.]
MNALLDAGAPPVHPGPRWPVRALLALIRFYQLAISPWLGRSCRFEPSCSRYAAACIASHGAAHGSLLSLKRLCKCHPFHAGGYDPPPPRGAKLPPLTRS